MLESRFLQRLFLELNHHGAESIDGETFAKFYLRAIKHVNALIAELIEHLFVMRNGHLAVFLAGIDEDHDAALIGIAEIAVGVVSADEMHCTAFLNDIIALAPIE